MTWAQYAKEVEDVAGGLATLGVQHGDRVMFLATNTPKLAIVQTAALHLGAATVIAYTASPPRVLAHLLGDSDPSVVVAESTLVERIRDLTDTASVVTFGDLDLLGPPAGFDFEAAWRAVGPSDLAGIPYTSGTTGLSKGVEWDHGRTLAMLDAFDRAWTQSAPVRDVGFAPMAHLAELALGHWRGLMIGSTRTFCPDPTKVVAAFLDARPTFIYGSPRLWCQLRATALGSLDADEHNVVERAIARLAAGDPISPSDESVLARLRSRIGMDRVERATTCAAPCPRHVQRFFHAIGVPFSEFWGMTEIGPVTQTRPGIADLDTVGVPLHGYEISLADDGEVLVRCRHVARGYRNRPEDTAATFGADGWVRTGDVGVLDEQGRLRIVDREKELIISSDGHNMAPAAIEAELKGETPLIAHACVIGDARPYNVALLVVEPAERASDPEAIAAVERAVDAVNARFDPRERVVRHAILTQPWLPGGDELTETNKLRHRAIAQKHAALIQSLYQASCPSRAEPASSSR